MELLGSESDIYINYLGNQIVDRSNNFIYKLNTKVYLKFKQSKLHLFEKEKFTTTL